MLPPSIRVDPGDECAIVQEPDGSLLSDAESIFTNRDWLEAIRQNLPGNGQFYSSAFHIDRDAVELLVQPLDDRERTEHSERWWNGK